MTIKISSAVVIKEAINIPHFEMNCMRLQAAYVLNIDEDREDLRKFRSPKQEIMKRDSRFLRLRGVMMEAINEK